MPRGGIEGQQAVLLEPPHPPVARLERVHAVPPVPDHQEPRRLERRPGLAPAAAAAAPREAERRDGRAVGDVVEGGDVGDVHGLESHCGGLTERKGGGSGEGQKGNRRGLEEEAEV